MILRLPIVLKVRKQFEIKELVLLQADLQKNVDKLGQNRNIPAGIAQDSLLAMVNNYKNKVKREYILRLQICHMLISLYSSR